MAFEDDDAEPNHKSKEERDAWQTKKYGDVRYAFREHGTLNDGRPVIKREFEFQFVPAIKARRTALASGQKDWTCPGCHLSYGFTYPECPKCNENEEALWLRAADLILKEVEGKDIKPSVTMSSIAEMATGLRPTGPLVKPMPKIEVDEW